MDPRPSNPYYAKAEALRHALNARVKASPTLPPDYEAVKAEIRRLYALSDDYNNGRLPPVTSDANAFPPVPEQIATPQPKPDMSGFPMPDDVASFKPDIADPVVGPPSYLGDAPEDPPPLSGAFDFPIPASSFNAPAAQLGFSGSAARPRRRPPQPAPKASVDAAEQDRRRRSSVDMAAEREAQRSPRQSTPADLDSVDAARSELTPDQAFRQRADEYVARHVAMVEREIAEKNAAAAAERGRRRQAQLEEDRAAQDVPPPDMSSTDVLPGSQPGTVRTWNPDTKRYDTVRVAPQPTPEPAPWHGRSVPGGPRTDGTQGAASIPFASQADADAYDLRRRADSLTPAEKDDRRQRARAGTANDLDAQEGEASPLSPKLAASERDLAMRARGFVPVFGPNGEIGYMLEAPEESLGVEAPRGAPGRWGRRPELLENTESGQPKHRAVPRNGPLGPQWVYEQTEELKQEIRTKQGRRELNRLIADSGLPAEVIQKAYDDGGIQAARRVANGAKAEAASDRRQAVVRRAQRSQNPQELLTNPTVSDWERRVVSEALLRSGRPGATPLDVQGQQMANMQRVMQQFATAGLANMQGNAQIEAGERQREAERRQRYRAAAAQVLGAWVAAYRTREEAIRLAMMNDATRAEAEAVADELFPNDGQGGRGPGRPTGARSTGTSTDVPAPAIPPAGFR